MSTFDDPYQAFTQPCEYQAPPFDVFNAGSYGFGSWIITEPASVSTTSGEVLSNGYTDSSSGDRQTYSSDIDIDHFYEGSDCLFGQIGSNGTMDSPDFDSAWSERSSMDLNDFGIKPTAIPHPRLGNFRKQPAASLCGRQRSSRIHPSKDMTCAYCSKTFTRARDRDRHVADIHTHEGDYYACTTCGYGSMRKDKVMGHCKRMHSGDAGYLVVDGSSPAKRRYLGNRSDGSSLFTPSNCVPCNPGPVLNGFDFR